MGRRAAAGVRNRRDSPVRFCRLRSLFGVAQQPAGVAVTFACRVCAGGPQAQSDLHAGGCLQSQRCSQYGNGKCCRYRQCGRPHDAPSCRDGCSQGFSKLENPGFPKASVTSQGWTPASSQGWAASRFPGLPATGQGWALPVSQGWAAWACPDVRPAGQGWVFSVSQGWASPGCPAVSDTAQGWASPVSQGWATPESHGWTIPVSHGWLAATWSVIRLPSEVSVNPMSRWPAWAMTGSVAITAKMNFPIIFSSRFGRNDRNRTGIVCMTCNYLEFQQGNRFRLIRRRVPPADPTTDAARQSMG